jgi:hypothetical protein
MAAVAGSGEMVKLKRLFPILFSTENENRIIYLSAEC